METNQFPFHDPLSLALSLALKHLDNAATIPVGATANLATLRAQLDVPLGELGLEAGKVVDDLVKGVAGGLHHSAGGRFFGWVIGGSLPAALAADWLTSAWDQNAALYACSPAASVVEEGAGKWLKEVLNLPATASFALVTGCQMAHMTCLAAARHSLLADRGWDAEQDGLAGAPPLRVLTSTERHGSTVRAIRLLGIGERNIVPLPADDRGCLLQSALAQALAEEPSRPTIVVLQAGDLNIGAFDDFATLIPLAKKHRAWVHVDGAFGLWVAASPALRHLLEGVELADSWATDGHKWLNVPYDSGYAFVANAEVHRAFLAHSASYITQDAQARDQFDWNPEWSRRGRGFATYAALRELGREGVHALIERTCAHAHALVVRIGSLPGAEMLWEPTINQGLVRFLDPRPEATEDEHDCFTNQVIAGILASGEAFFTGTTWRGKRAMRISVCNWQTSPEDVDRVVVAVEQVLRAAGWS
jgi:glutamate/tyrosine decarboxylase-like PLP-dependent enzyme